MADREQMRVLVMGGYGFIGAEIVRACLEAGHEVSALGRSRRRQRAGVRWITRDLTAMQAAQDWHDVLEGIDVVVNAAGSLQDSLRDRVADVQHRAIAALGQAAAKAGVRVVQISATGADKDADTVFMASKAAGDRALLDSEARAVILRPGLVMGRGVYGGTALLRMVAAIPLLQPRVMADSPVQVIAMQDLTRAVCAAVAGEIPAGTVCDLVADEPVPLGGLIDRVRGWLGFAPALVAAPVPNWLALALGRVADGLGWLGWRSPVRTSALRVLARGVTGDPGPWRALGQPMIGSLDTILAVPSTLQDRWHARLSLWMPVLVAGLSVFWVASGVIGIVQWKAAATLLGFAGFALADARLCVIGGGIADIALGLGVLIRPLARWACLGMIALSLAYLAASAWYTPWLWADPLGPMVKVLPGILLAGVLHTLLEDR